MMLMECKHAITPFHSNAKRIHKEWQLFNLSLQPPSGCLPSFDYLTTCILRDDAYPLNKGGRRACLLHPGPASRISRIWSLIIAASPVSQDAFQTWHQCILPIFAAALFMTPFAQAASQWRLDALARSLFHTFWSNCCQRTVCHPDWSLNLLSQRPLRWRGSLHGIMVEDYPQQAVPSWEQSVFPLGCAHWLRKRLMPAFPWKLFFPRSADGALFIHSARLQAGRSVLARMSPWPLTMALMRTSLFCLWTSF